MNGLFLFRNTIPISVATPKSVLVSVYTVFCFIMLLFKSEDFNLGVGPFYFCFSLKVVKTFHKQIRLKI